MLPPHEGKTKPRSGKIRVSEPRSLQIVIPITHLPCYCLTVYLYLSVFVFVCLSVCLYIHQSTYLYVCLFIHYLPIFLFVYLHSTCLSIYLDLSWYLPVGSSLCVAVCLVSSLHQKYAMKCQKPQILPPDGKVTTKYHISSFPVIKDASTFRPSPLLRWKIEQKISS